MDAAISHSTTTVPVMMDNMANADEALVPLYVSGVFREAPEGFRAELLECLMRPMGALGLVAVAGGAFAMLRQRHGWDRVQVTLDDAARITAEQVLELSAYLQQTAPEVFHQVGAMISGHPGVAGGLSSVLLLHVLSAGWRPH